MSFLNQIQQYPMQFIQPTFSPALSSNPEIAKAAQYGGGGAPASLAPQGAPAAGGTAPASPATPVATGIVAGNQTSGIMAQIMKLLAGL